MHSWITYHANAPTTVICCEHIATCHSRSDTEAIHSDIPWGLASLLSFSRSSPCKPCTSHAHTSKNAPGFQSAHVDRYGVSAFLGSMLSYRK